MSSDQPVNQTTPSICPLCKGKGRAIAVDAIETDGKLVNPRPAACMVCEGAGYASPDEDEELVNGAR